MKPRGPGKGAIELQLWERILLDFIKSGTNFLNATRDNYSFIWFSFLAPFPIDISPGCTPTAPPVLSWLCSLRAWEQIWEQSRNKQASYPTHTGKSDTICPTLHSFGLEVLIYSFIILLHAFFFN